MFSFGSMKHISPKMLPHEAVSTEDGKPVKPRFSITVNPSPNVHPCPCNTFCDVSKDDVIILVMWSCVNTCAGGLQTEQRVLEELEVI
jgi:hypothetical protein